MNGTGQVAVEGQSLPGVWVVDLPFQVPLSLNDRRNHMVEGRMRKQWRETTAWALKGARVPACKQVRLTLFYTPRVSRRHDEDNYVLAMKPVADALVDAGIVPDDTREFVERVWPVITPKDPSARPSRVTIKVEQLA